MSHSDELITFNLLEEARGKLAHVEENDQFLKEAGGDL